MGISTPILSASATAAAVVSTPSATLVIEARISSSVRPLESCTPNWWLRLSGLAHVAMRSPMPASPDRVSGLAPAATLRRAISARPRVMNPALALSPRLSPSHTPAPSAMMFLSDPPNSTPTTSSLVYTRNRGELTMSWAARAAPGLREAITVDAGRSSTISLARFGPDSTHTPERSPSGSSSSRISLMRLPVSSSRPLVALTMMAPSEMSRQTPRTFWRKEREGVAMMTRSAPPSASLAEAVARSPSGNGAPGRKRDCSPSSARVRASVSVRVSSSTAWPCLAAIMASVVPHAPVPTTPIAAIGLELQRDSDC